MEPVINPWLFYLIELADGLKLVFGGLGFAIGLVLILSGPIDSDCTYDENVKKKCQKRKKDWAYRASCWVFYLRVNPFI